jgi:hypothetical protein
MRMKKKAPERNIQQVKWVRLGAAFKNLCKVMVASEFGACIGLSAQFLPRHPKSENRG